MGLCNHPDCKYNSKLSQVDNTMVCHYCYVNEMSRGCDADKCIHYVPVSDVEKQADLKKRYSTLKHFKHTTYRGATS